MVNKKRRRESKIGARDRTIPPWHRLRTSGRE
nr:MAG TPA: Calpain-2 catalytic subunit [Caudoviricetes sp.]